MNKRNCLFMILFTFFWWVNSAAQEVFKNNSAVVTKVHEGMWVIEKADDHTTMYLIEGADKAMLVDAGNPIEKFDSIVKLITKKPILMMLTHGHGDHTGNIRYFDQIYLHPADTALLANRGYKGKVNFLKDGDVFDLGGKKIEVRHMPGHTMGSVVFLDKKTGDCFSGDTFGSGQVWLWITPVATMQNYLSSCQKMKVIIDQEGITKFFVGHSGKTNVYDKQYLVNMLSLSQSLVEGTPSTPPQKITIGVKTHLKVTLGNATIVYDPEQISKGKNDGVDPEDALKKSNTLQSTEKGYKVRGEIKYKQPIDLKDGIKTANAELLNVNLPLLMKAVNGIESDNQAYKKLFDAGASSQTLIDNGCIESFLLFKDGALISEEYFGFSDISIPHYQMSITKSVVSYAMGIAIDQGKVKSEKDFILDYLPEVDKTKLSKNSMNIRIKDLLSMQSGIRLTDLKYTDAKTDINKRVEQILTNSNTLEPGTEYKYYSIDPEIVVHILYNTTKMDVNDYVGKYLFAPMGITNYSFEKAGTGLTKAAAGMKLSSRDMLKLGILNLNKGKFNGKRIISSNWVEKANAKYVNLNKTNGYGYFWWTHVVTYNDKQYEINSCRGAHGQFIYVIPKLNSVAVFTSNGSRKAFSVLEDVVIPALSK